jgi:hypothetical protein
MTAECPEFNVTIHGLDAAEELIKIRRIPAQLLIAVRCEWLLSHGHQEPTIGDLYDWSNRLAGDRLQQGLDEMSAKVEEPSE